MLLARHKGYTLGQLAKPEIYVALEERGVKYAIRIPANDSLERDIG